MQGRRGYRRLIVAVFALTLAMAPAMAGGATEGDTRSTSTGATSTGTSSTGAAPEGDVLTLITGDRVHLTIASDGTQAAAIDPADRGGGPIEFMTFEHDGEVYVLPSDAAPLVPDVLDRELFNVTRLAEFGYTDGVPVIVTYDQSRTMAQADVGGLEASRALPSIDGVAATVTSDGAWWGAAAGDGDAFAATSSGPLAGIDKVWLDGQVEVALAESVPQIGAPAAWDAGYDGSGVTVAVLDTGIDENHPDLADRVVGAENFTTEPDETDEHGHGTHVASTVAGTGAASEGDHTGVAPGADLLNGKICNAGGSCQESWMIAGMEWAAQEADVINMSVGGGPTDGTDPLSQAVDNLTEEHGALFVIASGNLGTTGVSSPGAASAALTVGAVDKDDQLAGFSGRGPRVGDFAIKPDVTAPGVDIVAARADGTGMGAPVNDDYTSASGTSMATPHAAGAAAILLQQDPDLAPAEVKASLVTTADPHGDLTVFQEGGGRIHIPSALDGPVRASPAPADLGYFPYPHDDAELVEQDITFTNRTDEDITLDLDLQVVSDEGDVPPDEMLSVAPSAVTIDAGGTAEVTVTLDVSEGELGLYGGHLIADSGGEVVARVPVGFFKEPQMFDLTIEGVARDGRSTFSGTVHVMDVHDSTRFLETSIGFVDGAASVRVPPGTYSIMGVIYGLDGHDAFFQDRTMIGDPEVEVSEDTTITFDARDASPVTFATPEHPEAEPTGPSRIAYFRAAEDVGTFSASWSGDWLPAYALETDPVTIGDFEFNTRTTLTDPPMALSLVAPQEQQLSPIPMLGTPPLDDVVTLPVVWAGEGAPEDYEGIDAEGAAVLTIRGGPGHAAKEATASANGAAALMVMNDTFGNYSGFVGDGAVIPTMTLPGEEGTLLRDLLEDGEVTVELSGTEQPDYLYDLVFPEPDRIPAELHYDAAPGQLAALDIGYHSDVVEHERGQVRHMWRPFDSFSVGFVTNMPVPQQRMEYLNGGDTRYQQTIYAEPPFTAGMVEPITVYDAGERRDETWFRAPARAGVLEGGPHQAGEPARREGDTIALLLPEWVDAQPGHWGWLDASVDTSAFRLYQDGALIAEEPRPRGEFEVSAGPAEYRLEADVARDAPWWTTSTQTHTAWTVQSERPPAGETAILPLMLVDIDLPVDLTNTQRHPRDQRGQPRIEVEARHQLGADGADVDGARLWISTDDGGTWQERRGTDRGDGRFSFHLDARDVDEPTFVSLRVEAWDVDGNSVEYEVLRAWQRVPR